MSYDVCQCCGEFLVDRLGVCEYCEMYGGTPTLPCERYPHLRREERELKGVRIKPKEGKDFEWEHEYRIGISAYASVNVYGMEDDSDMELLARADTWGLSFDDSMEVEERYLREKNVRRVGMDGNEFDTEKWERENGLDEWYEPWEKERKEPKKITEF